MRDKCCGVHLSAANAVQCADCPGIPVPLGGQHVTWPPPQRVPPQYGWICPRCNVVHAPTVQTCHCQHMIPTFGSGLRA